MSAYDGVRADVQLCNKCGGRMLVNSTRTYGHGKLVRQRRCEVCDNRYVTYEITREEYLALIGAEEQQVTGDP